MKPFECPQKRLSGVFDDEVAMLGQEYASAGLAAELVEDDHSLVRFYVPNRPAGPIWRV